MCSHPIDTQVLWAVGILAIWVGVSFYRSPMKLSDKLIMPALIPAWLWVGTVIVLLIGGVFFTI